MSATDDDRPDFAADNDPRAAGGAAAIARDARGLDRAAQRVGGEPVDDPTTAVPWPTAYTLNSA